MVTNKSFELKQMTVDIVLPVYNEEKILAKSVGKLRTFLNENCPFEWRITIADNASNDSTEEIAISLSENFSEVNYVRIPLKGRGRALRQVWLNSGADIMSYMDIDLSTDLSCFMPMINKLANGETDIAYGSRYHKNSKVERGWKREILSRGYINLIKLFFGCGFTDSQCGFKAITKHAAQTLVPLVENQGWFFDAELLLFAEQYGFRVSEVPVIWIDDLDSRVNIAQTVSEHFIGLVRMRLAFSTGFAVAPSEPQFREVHA